MGATLKPWTKKKPGHKTYVVHLYAHVRATSAAKAAEIGDKLSYVLEEDEAVECADVDSHEVEPYDYDGEDICEECGVAIYADEHGCWLDDSGQTTCRNGKHLPEEQ